MFVNMKLTKKERNQLNCVIVNLLFQKKLKGFKEKLGKREKIIKNLVSILNKEEMRGEIAKL